MEYIDINKDELPESFEMDLGNETFTLSFSYNEMGDFFTVDLCKLDENGEEQLIVAGEKLILNQTLWDDFNSIDLPAPTLIPKDLSGIETRITWENFYETIFIYLDDDGDE